MKRVRTQGPTAARAATACAARAAALMGSTAQQTANLAPDPMQTRGRGLRTGGKTTMTCGMPCRSETEAELSPVQLCHFALHTRDANACVR